MVQGEKVHPVPVPAMQRHKYSCPSHWGMTDHWGNVTMLPAYVAGLAAWLTIGGVSQGCQPTWLAL